MSILYAISINLYAFAIRISSIWNSKARLWISGRRNWEKDLRIALSKKKHIHWFHCASLGEFEQARPLIEKIKLTKPEASILVSFFSPSGFEQKKNYELADYVCYLPLDTKWNAKKFVSSLDIAKAYFVKYEVWPNFFKELRAHNVPFYLISATFRSGQIYFRPAGKWFKKLLMLPEKIFVQNERSKDILKQHGIDSILAGDTRYDRVVNTAKKAIPNKIVKEFSSNKFTLIAGSSWEKEEEMIASFISHNPNLLKVVFAPHDISENHIKGIEKRVKPGVKTIRYSQVSEDANLQTYQVLIIDNIGLLSNVYQYGSVAFVGGGFTNALHNILEPATFGLPVFYGNNHPKYPEGGEMETYGAGFVVDSLERFEQQLLSLIHNEGRLELYSNKNKEFISSQTGATEIIFKATT